MSVATVVVAGMLAAQAGAPQTFSVSAGPATQSINRLAAQAGVDVAITTDLSGRRTPELRGRMTMDAAFERLLQPLGARSVLIGENAYRIEAAPPRTASPALQPPRPTTTQLSEIVVTAAPPVGLSQASGRTPVDNGALQRFEGAATSDAVADLTATVDSTRQGTGRNKLFVRGLADSAMNGPLQATVGQYLGDLRLSFGSPDPDLALVDIRRIEVFEGPQGTRFGVGAIGGVLRIEPAAPELDEASGRLILGGAATSGGGESGDVALVLNQPFSDQVAGRVAAYARREAAFWTIPRWGCATRIMWTRRARGGRFAGPMATGPSTWSAWPRRFRPETPRPSPSTARACSRPAGCANPIPAPSPWRASPRDAGWARRG